MISIIVPVYGVEKYLRQCVDSVLAQTYSNWELILVDDGSPDACPQICDEYSAADPRIRVIHQSNGGVSVARNSGISHSSGEYIIFIDSDDKVHPEYIADLYRMAVDLSVDVACVDFISSENSYIKKISSENKVFSGVDFCRRILYQNVIGINPSPWGKLIKSEFLTDNFFPEGIRYEDLFSISLLFTRVNRVAYSPSKLYYYRPNPQSYLHCFTPRRADVLDVTDRMVEYFGESGAFPNKDLHKAARDRRMSAHFNIFGLMAANSYKDYDLEERCWMVIKSERLSSLLNPEVRVKNKLGALISYFGKPALRFISRLIYR